MVDWQNLEMQFQSYIRGDSATTRRLFETLQKIIKAYFSGKLGSKSTEIDDLTQLTLMKIHFARDRFDPSQQLKTWIFTIASRSLIDFWRGSKADYIDDSFQDVSGTDPMESLPAEGLSPEEKLCLTEDLNHFLKTLKPIDRAIVYLYGVEGFSMAEIAKMHSMSEGATKVRAHRAYQELKKSLSEKTNER